MGGKAPQDLDSSFQSMILADLKPDFLLFISAKIKDPWQGDPRQGILSLSAVSVIPAASVPLVNWSLLSSVHENLRGSPEGVYPSPRIHLTTGM